MGQNQAILIGLLAGPVLLIMGLRINATMVFLSLCLGYVVMQFLGADAQSFAELFMTHAAISSNIMKLALLLFPVVFTALFMIHTIRGAKLVLNVLPAVGVGCLTVLFVVPLLPPGTAHAIGNLQWWRLALQLQAIVVGAGALVSVFFLWMQRPHKDADERGRR
jgi:hypothetical protein